MFEDNKVLGLAKAAVTGLASSQTSKKEQLAITKVENGFVVTQNFSTSRVYVDFDSMIADLKTYFTE